MAKGKTKPAAAAPAGADDAGAAKPKGGRKRLVMIAVPVLLTGAGAGLWFTGVLPRMLGLAPEHKAAAVAAAPAAPVFVEMPEMVANLNSTGRKASFVKIAIKLEVPKDSDAEKVRAAMPRLQDLMQTYLRDMRPEELRGSAGTYRLREELIARANLAAAPGQVSDVLFTEMLVQ
ncbi:MAG: flagellar basal body-associated FliL family protein [Proteobacteria bacterium]|nr:flagellar basal body-associated FliL family protein [Pseudomonadota bacterium]